MNHEIRNVTVNKGDGFPIIAITPERNSKCKCGSGKKTKNCCGTKTQFISTKTDRITKNLKNIADIKKPVIATPSTREKQSPAK